LLEIGVYYRMLALQYMTERPLPDEPDRLFAAIGASSAAEKRAVEILLKKHFRKPGGRMTGWVQQRASKEIAKYRQYISNCSTGGKHSQLIRKSTSSSPQLDFDNLNDEVKEKRPKTLQPPATRGGSDFPQYVSASREGSGLREVAVHVYGDIVLVHKPANRRLWTQSEKDSLVGAGAEQVAEFFIKRKGYQAEVLPNGNLAKEE
jgi:uncharacterized protein YdaU (DUF1376 family)